MTLVTDLPVIEVPPELRGLSDKEIIAASESRKKKFENSFRPSKRERDAQKLRNAREKLSDFVGKAADSENSEPKSSIPMPDFGHEQPPNTEFQKKAVINESFMDLFAKVSEPAPIAAGMSRKEEIVVRSSISATPRSSSGRVLTGKFTFGKKISATTVVSALDLERERAEERAKKILLQQKPAKTPLPVEYDADGNPIKRKRGRPRKNPVE